MTTLDEIAADVKAIRGDLSKCHRTACALGCELYQGALADLERVKEERAAEKAEASTTIHELIDDRDDVLARVKALEDAVRTVRELDDLPLPKKEPHRRTAPWWVRLDALYALLDKEA